MNDVIQLVRAPELRVPARLDALDGIARYVSALAGRAGLGKDAVYRLRLAVDELATNVVIHGYRGADGQITVAGGIETDRVWVRIEDAAPPFDPRDGMRPPDDALPPESRRVGGLGVHLALTSVDLFTHAFREDRNISTLTILSGRG